MKETARLAHDRLVPVVPQPVTLGPATQQREPGPAGNDAAHGVAPVAVASATLTTSACVAFAWSVVRSTA